MNMLTMEEVKSLVEKNGDVRVGPWVLSTVLDGKPTISNSYGIGRLQFSCLEDAMSAFTWIVN